MTIIANSVKHQKAHGSLGRTVRALTCVFFPLGAFGLINLGAESIGQVPLFFAPFGLPGWIGAIAHLLQLGLLGGAYAMLTRDKENAGQASWLMLTIAAFVLLPFFTPLLDSMQMALATTGLALFALATHMRVSPKDRTAGRLMLPTLALLGLSTVLGLLMTAAYTPPFAPLYSAPHGTSS